MIPDTLKADLVRTGTGGDHGNTFTAGESYMINITLYGPEEIEITATLTPWTQSDDDINIGQD